MIVVCIVVLFLSVHSTSNGIEELHDYNFDRTTASTSTSWMVKFYAPWCAHCKHVAPEFARVRSTLSASDDIRLGKVRVLIWQSTFQINILTHR